MLCKQDTVTYIAINSTIQLGVDKLLFELQDSFNELKKTFHSLTNLLDSLYIWKYRV